MKNTEILYRYIEKIAKKILNDKSSKPVVTGTIITSLPGEYEVKLFDGSESSFIKAVSLYKDHSFAKDDYVYLVKAESGSGDLYDASYFIVGLVSKIDYNFKTLNESERFLGDGQKITKLESDKNEADCINFYNALRTNGVLSFSANVTTNILKRKDFGFNFIITYDDETEENIKFSHQSFIGQPWLLKDVKQTKIFNFGTNNKIKKIEIAQYGNEDLLLDEKFSFEDFSLETGSLLNALEDFQVTLNFVSGKNYINKDSLQDEVTIQAKVKYENQILNTNELKYYWFVKTDNENEDYHILGGPGWKCLNQKSLMKIVKNGVLEEDDRFLQYSVDSDKLIITGEKAQEWLPRYENKIKCVVSYQLLNKESDSIKVYNFNQESYEINLIKENGEVPLLKVEEYITLKAEISEKIVIPDNSDLKISYKWFKETKNGPVELVYVIDGQKKSYNSDTLKIYGDSKEENTEEKYFMKESAETIFCALYLGNNVFDNQSNSIQISSKISTLQDLSTNIEYRYWIDTNNNIDFKSGIKEADVEIKTNNSNIKEKDEYTFYYRDENDEGSSSLNLENLESGIDYYMYSTEQNIIIDKNNSNKPVRYDDYYYPKIIRCININEKGAIEDVLSQDEINQLNTFNTLTNGGKSKGIEYNEKDKDLYINATYIRSGALTIKKENEENPIFEAGFRNNTVLIAGFEVNQNSLFKKDTEDNNFKILLSSTGIKENDNDNNKIYFKINDAIQVDDGGAHIKGSADFGNQTTTISADGYFKTISANIGGWEIRTNSFSSGAGTNYIALNTEEGKPSLWAGSEDGENAPFWIKKDGSFKATKGSIGGFHIFDDHLGSGAIDEVDHKDDQIRISPGKSDDDFVFWAGKREEGSEEDSSRPFWIKKNGSFKATKGYISFLSTFQDEGVEKEQVIIIGQDNYNAIKIYNNNDKNQISSFNYNSIIFETSQRHGTYIKVTPQDGVINKRPVFQIGSPVNPHLNKYEDNFLHSLQGDWEVKEGDYFDISNYRYSRFGVVQCPYIVLQVNVTDESFVTDHCICIDLKNIFSFIYGVAVTRSFTAPKIETVHSTPEKSSVQTSSCLFIDVDTASAINTLPNVSNNDLILATTDGSAKVFFAIDNGNIKSFYAIVYGVLVT